MSTAVSQRSEATLTHSGIGIGSLLVFSNLDFSPKCFRSCFERVVEPCMRWGWPGASRWTPLPALLGREVAKQVAASAETGTPNLHRARNRSLRVRMGRAYDRDCGRGSGTGPAPHPVITVEVCKDRSFGNCFLARHCHSGLRRPRRLPTP